MLKRLPLWFLGALGSLENYLQSPAPGVPSVVRPRSHPHRLPSVMNGESSLAVFSDSLNVLNTDGIFAQHRRSRQISRGKSDSHADRLDEEAVDTIKAARLHRKVATTVFFESNGGQRSAEATIPEIRLAVAGPRCRPRERRNRPGGVDLRLLLPHQRAEPLSLQPEGEPQQAIRRPPRQLA